MSRAGLVLLLLLAAPGAAAWVPCSSAGLEPPAPLEREPPAYPEAVRATGIEGSIEVALTVLRDGRVGWVRVLNAAPAGYFEQAAAEGVRRWRFTPARRDGEPVECRLLTRVRFALTDEVTAAAGSDDAGRAQPIYPPALLGARIEGYVEVEYALDAAGRVQDAQVTMAMPRGEFEQAAACARGATGRVVLEVDTLGSGEVRAARIVAAEPAGLFDEAALAIARGSRLSPAYRDAEPIPATALVTLRFDPARAGCPGSLQPDRERPCSRRPPPKVTWHGESTVERAKA